MDLSDSKSGVTLLIIGIVLNTGVSIFGRPQDADGKRRRTATGVVLTTIAGLCLVAALILLLLGR